MNDPVSVEVLQSSNDLHSVALDLEFVEALSPLEQLVETLVLTELKQDVHILCVLEKVLELGNMVVLNRPMYFDFRH